MSDDKKVVSDEPLGTITVEVPQHTLQKIRNKVVKAVNIQNVRGLSQFFGLGAFSQVLHGVTNCHVFDHYGLSI